MARTQRTHGPSLRPSACPSSSRLDAANAHMNYLP